MGQLHFLNIVLMEGGGKRDNRGQVGCPVRKENLDISFSQTLSSPPRLWIKHQDAEGKATGMWEVREQGQNMGWGLRAEPAGKGQTAQIRNKGRIIFFLLRVHLIKLN